MGLREYDLRRIRAAVRAALRRKDAAPLPPPRDAGRCPARGPAAARCQRPWGHDGQHQVIRAAGTTWW